VCLHSFATVSFDKDSCCDDTIDSKETKCGDIETDSEKGSDARVAANSRGHEHDLNEAFVAEEISMDSVDAYICSLAQAKDHRMLCLPHQNSNCCSLDKDSCGHDIDFLNSGRRASTNTTASLDTLDDQQHPNYRASFYASQSQQRMRLDSHDEEEEIEYSDDEDWGYVMDARPPTPIQNMINTSNTNNTNSSSSSHGKNGASPPQPPRVPALSALFGVMGIAFEKSYPQPNVTAAAAGNHSSSSEEGGCANEQENDTSVEINVHTVQGGVGSREDVNVHRVIGTNVDNSFPDCNV
jgi:hypothetical protein